MSICVCVRHIKIFQSTLPVGGATVQYVQKHALFWDFNPRSPWGERLYADTDSVKYVGISIHAPRGGSDIIKQTRQQTNANAISIHAPRGGSDSA